MSYANLRHSTGLVLTVYRIQILAVNWYRSIIDSWHSTGLLLTQYWLLLLLVKYRQMWNANIQHSTVLMLAVNRIEIRDINRHRNLIDSWRSSGLLLVQYWLSLLAKYRQRRYANLGHSTGWVLAVYNVQIRDINRHGSLFDSWNSAG